MKYDSSIQESYRPRLIVLGLVELYEIFVKGYIYLQYVHLYGPPSIYLYTLVPYNLNITHKHIPAFDSVNLLDVHHTRWHKIDAHTTHYACRWMGFPPISC
jgi:hypothetical protein